MPNLLIVEDNAILADTLVKFLRNPGQMTVVAVVPSAEAALALLPKLTVDLVLVDVALPGMNGIDLVAILREQYPKLPCLMLSGHKEAHYIQRALAAGARGYVVKDNAVTLLAAVQRILSADTSPDKDVGKVIPN
jgi:DNA-binding NarL/FixJ family response regulator